MAQDRDPAKKDAKQGKDNQWKANQRRERVRAKGRRQRRLTRWERPSCSEPFAGNTLLSPWTKEPYVRMFEGLNKERGICQVKS